MKEEPTFEAQNLTDLSKEKVREVAFGIANLRKILEMGFERISKHEVKKAVIVVGDTGCGKSTLLSSL